MLSIIKQNFKPYIVISVLLAGLLALSSCNTEIEKTNEIITKDSLPEVLVKNIEMAYTDSGVTRMKLIATELQDFTKAAEPYTVFTKGIYVVFNDNFGTKESTLKAGYARYDQNKDIWEYKYNVEIVNIQGDRLSTNHLYADRNKKKLYSKELVKISTADGGSFQGAGGFISNLDFTEYEFKQVSGDLKF